MRLTQEQKNQALSNRPGAQLVRVGEGWAAVWKDGRDYCGQNLRKVIPADVSDAQDGPLAGKWITWWGPEFSSRKRRELIALLLEDAT